MAKSDARFEYRANLKRDDHDLSQKFGFTSAPGMLLPIWFDLATPGDAYYMRHKMPLLRSTQLAAPAMVDVKVHFETFFVPMQMIYEPFENTLYSLKNFRSSNYYNLTGLMNNRFPLFDYPSYINEIKTNETDSDFRADAFRLADCFGLVAENFAQILPPDVGLDVNNGRFFPYQILAYHTIFQYYYRLDDKSQFTNEFSNWDKYYDELDPISMDPDFMSVHQRPWEFDYFTSIYRSPIVSDSNVQSVLPQGIYSDLISNPNYYGSNTQPIDQYGQSSGANNLDVAFAANLGQNYSQQNNSLAISTASIRQMFANEKLAMITGRAKKSYDAQVLAHLGYDVPHDVKHDITMIHHDEYDLNIQEVTSLASTEQSPLGELAGKSYASGNGDSFKFTAPCHGVIMTIFSIEPKRKYFGTFDKLNVVTDAFDVPTPEFDRLGNVPMFRSEAGTVLHLDNPNMRYSDIIGWKERFYQNKRKLDKVSMAFSSATGYSSDSVNNYAAYQIATRPFSNFIEYDAYQTPRPDLENRFYIPRNAMNPLCMIEFSYGWKHETEGENWDLTPWLVYARDPFIIDSDIQCKKVSWMSKDGEPIYL